MLGCPATNRNEFNLNTLKSSIQEKQVSAYLSKALNLNADFTESRLSGALRTQLSDMKKKVLEYAQREEFFLLLDQVIYSIYDIWASISDEKSFIRPRLPTTRELLATDIKHSGVYITTRFDSFDCLNVSLRGNKVTLNDLKGKTKKFQLLSHELPLSSEALSLLKDYLSFTFEKPFSFQAACASYAQERSPLETARDAVASCLFHLETGVALIRSRDCLREIDINSMREIVSWAEGSIIGIFMNPKDGTSFV
jgi:hypothetical protein